MGANNNNNNLLHFYCAVINIKFSTAHYKNLHKNQDIKIINNLIMQ